MKKICRYYLQQSDTLDENGKIDGICMNPLVNKRDVNHLCNCSQKERS